jgi:hypothetical protein
MAAAAITRPSADAVLINSLRGGQNDTDHPLDLPLDQAPAMRNVEFVSAPCGQRRLGATAADISSASATFGSKEYVTWLHRHLPTSDESASQLWGMSVTGSATSYAIGYMTTTWNAVSPVDAISIGGGGISGGFKQYELNSVSTQGKMFLAHYSAVDRLHVWDGTSLRRVGIAAASAAPTGANTAAVGTFSGTRYYRVRFTKQSGGVTQLRSEPSATLTFSPSGTNTGVTVTRPTAPGDSETHWELEASIDNANFYVLATTVLATTTATDTTALGTGYNTGANLSPELGKYSVPTSVRFVAVDQDKLLGAGSLTNDVYASRVWWSATYGDSTGVGNEERFPTDVDSFLDLDPYEGGAITALHGPVNGYSWVFKRRHIYKLVRTGQREDAYRAVCISKTCGAIRRSCVEAFDENGKPALYFLDPSVGPCRVGVNGLEYCGRDIRNTWATVNQDASGLVCFGLYYPTSRQIRWWLSTTGNSSPRLVAVLHLDHIENSGQGIRKGYTFWDGDLAQALCGVLYADNFNASSRSKNLVPYLGMGVNNTAAIWRTETTNQDNGTNYTAYVQTKPLAPFGPLRKFGIQSGNIVAQASSGTTLAPSITTDFGTETFTGEVIPLTAAGSETYIMKYLDDFSDSEMKAATVKIADDSSDSTPGYWAISQIALRVRPEQGQ